MKECCETGAPRRRYAHWIVLGAVGAVVIALLSVPRVIVCGSRTVCSKARADVAAICASLDEYASDHEGVFPATLDPLVAPDENGRCYLEGYNGKVPKDPWKHDYQYVQPTPAHPKPRVISFGADGEPLGEGESADIDSDELASER